MTRKRASDEGSMDLLLDTICNTFGGVLFISILVVLLLNVSSTEATKTPPDASARTRLVEAQTQLAKSNDQVRQLLTALETQEQIADQIVDPELKQLVQECRQLQQGIVNRAQAKVNGIDQIAKDQIDINDRSQKIQENEEALKNAQRNLAGMERRLQQEIEARTQAAKLPKGRGTSKSEIPMFLKAGRLCTYVKWGAGGLEENLDDIAKLRDDQNRQYIEPKPGAGIPVNLEDGNADIDERLSHFDPEKHYLAIFVWPDSFNQFAKLKDRMVVQEFEYRLVPFSGEQKIFFGANEQPVEVQ